MIAVRKNLNRASPHRDTMKVAAISSRIDTTFAPPVSASLYAHVQLFSCINSL